VGEEAGGDDPDDSSAFPELISLIRYPLMGMKEFGSEVVSTGVLSESLVIGMFLYLSG
jgi:hypothetical protein